MESSPRSRRRFTHAGLTLILGLLSACAEGDFGRIRSSLVTDDMHAWIGTEAVGSIGVPASRFGLTEEERELRDLAYPLIEAPFDRHRWYSILGEYGVARVFRRDWWQFDPTAYSTQLMARHYRSGIARYAQLIEDIRNDIVRIAPFFRTAARVVDLDQKRQQSMTYIPNLSAEEHANAANRVSENQLVIAWVHHSLNGRTAAYRHALERLVIAYPSPMAIDAERALNQLRAQIGENQLVAAVEFGTPHQGPTRAVLSSPVSK
jgi:hypothetical protein